MKFKIAITLAFFLSASVSHAANIPGRYFDKVIFVIFENTNYQDAIKQPYFRELANAGAHFNNFSAITHPSQGNYIALTSGSLNGVSGDGKYNLNVNHIADLLESRGISWKVYAEDYPGGCFLGSSNKSYARKHNPFISYINIQNNPQRCANIVSSADFDRDAAAGNLPQYIFYVPNENNDGHDTGIKFADQWYRQRFSSYYTNVNFMRGTLVITTFDESAGARGNPVYTSLFGPMVVGNSVISDSLNHYILLKLVEENWNIGSLGKGDDSAKAIPNIWK